MEEMKRKSIRFKKFGIVAREVFQKNMRYRGKIQLTNGEVIVKALEYLRSHKHGELIDWNKVEKYKNKLLYTHRVKYQSYPIELTTKLNLPIRIWEEIDIYSNNVISTVKLSQGDSISYLLFAASALKKGLLLITPFCEWDDTSKVDCKSMKIGEELPENVFPIS